MSANKKVDYGEMFKQMKESLERIIAEDEEYFDLLKKLQDDKPYTTVVNKHLLELKKKDQLHLLRNLNEYGEMCKQLCFKYHLEDEVENG